MFDSNHLIRLLKVILFIKKDFVKEGLYILLNDQRYFLDVRFNNIFRKNMHCAYKKIFKFIGPK